MPIRFQYDPTLNILFTTAEGLLSLREIEVHLSEEFEARGLAYPELIDASAATTDLNAEEVRSLVRSMTRLMKHLAFGPTALVTVDPGVFGMARMFAIISDLQGGPSLAVFRTFNEALQWLLSHPDKPTAY